MAKKKSDAPELILRAYKSGYDTYEIAQSLNKTEESIYNLITRRRDDDYEKDRSDDGLSPKRKQALEDK